MNDDLPTISEHDDKLTDLQRRMCEHLVLDGLSKAASIKKAGYASQAAGYSVLKKQHIRAYIQGLINEHLQNSSIKAIHCIDKLITDARSDYVKLEASKDVLDRAGFKPVDRHAHLHGGEVTIKIDLT